MTDLSYYIYIDTWSEDRLSGEYANAMDREDTRAIEVLGKELARRRIAGEKPPCKLVGEDGNVFSIIARVNRTLKQAGLPSRAKEFMHKAAQSRGYDAVLTLCDEYVEVE
jgi:hypothetical protein